LKAEKEYKYSRIFIFEKNPTGKPRHIGIPSDKEAPEEYKRYSMMSFGA
jgi:hypothetical protein